jgi:two-component system, NtrC family, sensor kinase
MFKTVKSKFIGITLILIIISVGIPFLFLIDQFKQNFDQRSEIMIKSSLDVVIRGIYDKMMTDDHEDVQLILSELSKNESIDHIRIINKDGSILFSSDIEEKNKQLEIVREHHTLESLKDTVHFTILKDEGIYSVIQPIGNTPNCQRCHEDDGKLGYIDIDTKLTQAETYFQTGSLHIIFLAILIIIVLFFIFYFVFTKLINQPLHNFINAMDKIKNGDLTASLPGDKKDEIGVLEKNFNGMVKKLSESQNKIEEMHFDQLRHADKLVTLGELAAEMAHEINNPAAIIMARADYLQMESDSNFQLVNYKEDFEVIVNQTQRVSKITQNILRYGKKLPKNFEQIELIQILNESTKILEPRIHKKKIKLKKEFNVDKAFIFGDAVQIEQVLTNLVNNSIDSINGNGELVIQVNKSENQEIVLTISDTGHGIEDHIKEKIFSPFFTTKLGNKGTGLGLYIVNNICKNHSADIECASEAGKGTKFIITFKSVKSV